MKRIILTLLLYGFLCNYVEAQPINMIEREMRFSPDSLRNRYLRGEIIFDNNYPKSRKESKIQSENETQVSDLSNFEVESEVYAAINPKDSNNIVVSPIFQNETSSNPELFCSVYYTLNGGNSWNTSNFRTPTYQFDDAMLLGGGDPVLAFDNNGRVYLTWLYLFQTANGNLHTTLYWAYSEDGGANWIEPNNPFISHFIMSSVNASKVRLADKQWMAVNKNNDLFVSYTYIEQTSIGQTADIYVAKLPYGSTNFEKPIKISGPFSGLCQFSTITIDLNQNIHLLNAELKRDGELLLIHSISEDGGNTFKQNSYVSSISMPKSIFNQSGSRDTVVGITTRRLYPAPMIMADASPTSKYKNHLYAVWNGNGVTKNLGNKLDIYFSKSIDGGQHWESPKILSREKNSRPVSQFYPSIAVNSDGVIAVSYYDRNEDVNFDTHTDYVIQYSYDGGKSFTEPKKVNTISTDFRDIGEKNGDFGIGEYNMLLLTNNYAMPIWADGREGDGRVRIYAAKVGLDTNGIEVLYSLSAFNKINNVYIDANNNLVVEKVFTKESNFKYTLYNLSGKLIFETDERKGEKGYTEDKISLENLITGVYFIYLDTDIGYSVAKFIKN